MRGNFAQIDPTDALILIHMDLSTHFYISKMVRQIGSRQSPFKVYQIFIRANLVNEAGLGTITIRNWE